MLYLDCQFKESSNAPSVYNLFRNISFVRVHINTTQNDYQAVNTQIPPSLHFHFRQNLINWIFSAH